MTSPPTQNHPPTRVLSISSSASSSSLTYIPTTTNATHLILCGEGVEHLMLDQGVISVRATAGALGRGLRVRMTPRIGHLRCRLVGVRWGGDAHRRRPRYRAHNCTFYTPTLAIGCCNERDRDGNRDENEQHFIYVCIAGMRSWCHYYFYLAHMHTRPRLLSLHNNRVHQSSQSPYNLIQFSNRISLVQFGTTTKGKM